MPPAGTLRWRPTVAWAAGLGLFAFLSLQAMVAGAPSAFLYFQF
jgi:hypothetical protein